MKICFLILATFLFIACSDNSPSDDLAAKNERVKAKNQQTAALNESILITETAQKLEKEGRAMDLYRDSSKSKNSSQCGSIMEDQQKQVKDLEDRIKKLPEPFNARLSPIIADLNECVSCAKGATASCVKTRATINAAIKQLYP